MKYVKPPLTLEQQADQLLHRGMVGDRDLVIARLRSVSYYRLSGYWFPFRNADDSFKPGTSFDAVWNRYVFDRRLRLLVMDAIERIEVAVRSQLAHHGRLWNRELGVKPMIPLEADYPDWHRPVIVRNNRVFAVLTMCRWCLERIAPQSHWAKRLHGLLNKFSGIPPRCHGLSIQLAKVSDVDRVGGLGQRRIAVIVCQIRRFIPRRDYGMGNESYELTDRAGAVEVIRRMSEDDLRFLNWLVVERLKLIHQTRNTAMLARFSVGDRVSFQTHTGEQKTGVIPLVIWPRLRIDNWHRPPPHNRHEVEHIELRWPSAAVPPAWRPIAFRRCHAS